MATLTNGTTIRRLNHLEYPAFEKMNQKGRMIKTERIKQMIKPKGPIYIGMCRIMSGMEFPLAQVHLYLEISHQSLLAVNSNTPRLAP